MQVTLPKVRLPERRKDIFRRVRLIDALHQNLHRKLTFISAPAGYGKTVLLVDFAADVEAEVDAVVCWYSIGAEDAALVPFTQHLIAAFQQHFPHLGLELTVALEASDSSPDPYSLAAGLVNEMVAHVDDFCVLLLDDYHFVGETPAIVELIEAMLEHLPDHVRLVIAGRSDLGIPAATLYVHEELKTFGTEDLRFRATELQALVRRNYRVKLSNEQAASLAERADGWIVAILLALRTMEHGALPTFERATEQVYAFLAEEVFNRQPAQIRELLLTTAILDEFDEPLCDYLLETSRSGDGSATPSAPLRAGLTTGLLRDLEARNLFVTRIESAEGTSYRYHQLFADFLRDRLQTTDPARARALHRRAAEWYARREAWERAVRHRLAAGERAEAAQWMDRVALQFFVAGRTHALSKWVDALAEPPDLRAHAPRLALNQAKTHIDQNSFEAAEQLLDIAEPVLRRQGDNDQVANALLLRSLIRRYQGRYTEALALAQSTYSLSENEGYRWYHARRFEGFSLSRLGQPEEAIAQLETAVAGLRRLEKAHDLAETLNDLGVVQIERGNMLEAQRCFQEVLQIRRSQGSRGALARALNNVGYVYYQAGRYREAWRAYEDALEAAQSGQWSRVIASILNGQGDLLRDLEEWDAAQTAYESAREICEATGEQENLPYAYAGLSELARLRGHFDDALHWLREATRCRGDGAESPAYQANLGATYLDMDQLDLARQALGQALAAWHGSRQPRQDQALAALRLARARFQAGEAEAALDALAQALQWAAQLGYDQFLVVAGRRARPLLLHAAETWPDHAQLWSLIERVDRYRTGLASLRSESTLVESKPAAHLELLAFGPGRVRRNGELISTAGWVPRSRALFFYVVERGGARKEEILLDFWPDSSPAKVSSTFHVTLSRARQALGGLDVLPFDGRQYRLAESVTIWYDVAEFEAYVRRATTDDLSPEERAEAWRQAIALYTDDYLEDIFLDWAVRRRAELQDKYLLALTSLANGELDRRHYLEAKALYEEVVGIDAYQDQARAGMMKCLARLVSPAAAEAYFLDYKEQLRAELDTEPAQELQQLYDQIRRRR